MSYRFMRILVMFDLPSITIEQKRNYRIFRRFLIKSGFMMLQQSIYCKLALNATVGNAIVSNIRKNKPVNGLVQVITVTEKQFSKMEIITGEYTATILDTDERLVII